MAIALSLALVVLTSGAWVPAASGSGVPVNKALDYVAACQRNDGGFAEKTASASSDALTAWTIVGIASAGQDPNAWRRGGKSPVEYLSTQSAKWRTETDYARTVLAACAAERDPRAFGGVDLIACIRAGKQDHGDAGDSFGPYVNSHIWSLLALKASGEAVSAREVAWLISQQNADGGWGWAPTVSSDSNDVAAAIEALVACGQSPSSEAVRRGIEYLRVRQASGGGFNSTGGAADANSTAWAIQALLAAGEDPSGSAWKEGAGSPMSALIGFQQPSGAMRYTAANSANPLLATVQSLPPLALRSFPLARGTAASTLFPSAPTVALTAPAAGSTVVQSVPVTIKLSVSDGNGTGIDPGTLRVSLDGKRISARLSGSVVTAAPVTLGAGQHAVVVTVADRAGNAVTSPAVTFGVGAMASASTATATTAESTVVAGASLAAPGASSQLSSTASAPIDDVQRADDEASPAAEPVAAVRRSWPTPAVVAVGIAAPALVAALVTLLVWWLRRRKG